MAVQIDKELCLGCGCCMDACAFGALEFESQKDAAWAQAISNDGECTECGECLGMCPNEALSL